MKQMHQKDREDQEEELEDVRQSCQKRVCDQQVELCPWALAGPVLMPSSLEWGMWGGVDSRAWGQTVPAIPYDLSCQQC